MKAKIRKFIEEQLDHIVTINPDWHWHWNKDKNHPRYYLYKDRYECNLKINKYLIMFEIDDINLSMTYENYIHKKYNISLYYHTYNFESLKHVIWRELEFFYDIYNDEYSNEWWMNPAKEENNGQTN